MRTGRVFSPSRSEAHARTTRRRVAGKMEPVEEEPPKAAEEVGGSAGQWSVPLDPREHAETSRTTEDLVSMVKKLQEEGSLEPQIEDLINRINELQQAKKKSSEELGEAQAHWEALHRELDTLNGEKVHLEEVLSKKREARMILQQHWQERESEAQRMDVEEQLEDLIGQHKDIWEFYVLEQRLAQEIRALERSREQLQAERTLVRTRLQDVERRLRSAPQGEGALPAKRGLKAELQKLEGQSWSSPEPGGLGGEVGPQDGVPETPGPRPAARAAASPAGPAASGGSARHPV